METAQMSRSEFVDYITGHAATCIPRMTFRDIMWEVLSKYDYWNLEHSIYIKRMQEKEKNATEKRDKRNKERRDAYHRRKIAKRINSHKSK